LLELSAANDSDQSVAVIQLAETTIDTGRQPPLKNADAAPPIGFSHQSKFVRVPIQSAS